MGSGFGRLPRGFRLLFITVMLLICAELAWFVPTQYQLRYQIDDLTLSLDTSRQRERKQQYEYDQVLAALPEAQAQLDELSPKAEAAQTFTDELKATRKSLRTQNADLDTRLTDAQTALAEVQAQVDATQAEVDALKAQAAALLEQIDAP